MNNNSIDNLCDILMEYESDYIMRRIENHVSIMKSVQLVEHCPSILADGLYDLYNSKTGVYKDKHSIFYKENMDSRFNLCQLLKRDLGRMFNYDFSFIRFEKFHHDTSVLLSGEVVLSLYYSYTKEIYTTNRMIMKNVTIDPITFTPRGMIRIKVHSASDVNIKEQHMKFELEL